MISTAIKVDNARFNAAFSALCKNIGGTLVPEVLRAEAREIIKLDIRMTNAGVMRGKTLGTTARRANEQMVKTAIRRTMNPLLSETFKDSVFANLMKRIVEKGDLGYANAIFNKIKVGRFRGARAVEFNPFYHEQNINGRDGHALYTNFRLIRAADIAKLGEYVSKKQQNVGYKFAGWGPAATSLSLKLPKYISRHGPAAGQYTESMGGLPTQSFVIIGNRSKMHWSSESTFRRVIQARANAMMNKARRLMRGEAVNLGFKTVGGTQSTETVQSWKLSAEFIRSFDGGGE